MSDNSKVPLALVTAILVILVLGWLRLGNIHPEEENISLQFRIAPGPRMEFSPSRPGEEWNFTWSEILMGLYRAVQTGALQLTQPQRTSIIRILKEMRPHAAGVFRDEDLISQSLTPEQIRYITERRNGMGLRHCFLFPAWVRGVDLRVNAVLSYLESRGEEYRGVTTSGAIMEPREHRPVPFCDLIWGILILELEAEKLHLTSRQVVEMLPSYRRATRDWQALVKYQEELLEVLEPGQREILERALADPNAGPGMGADTLIPQLILLLSRD